MWRGEVMGVIPAAVVVVVVVVVIGRKVNMIMHVNGRKKVFSICCVND